MSLLAKIKIRLKRESFQPTWLGMLINPVFIVRRGLFSAIKKNSTKITGDILDFGCGSKPYENLFASAGKYIGCDIEVSGHNHKDSKVDYFFDGKILPFMDEKFDAVVAFEVFEHIFNLPVVLKEINRVTKPDGFLLISIPFVWAEHEAPYDFARYTSFGISHLLKENGYQIVEFNKTGNYLLTVFQLMVAYVYQCLAPLKRLIHFFQLLVIFPLILLAYLLNTIFPKRYDLFYGCVVLARKVDVQVSNNNVSIE